MGLIVHTLPKVQNSDPVTNHHINTDDLSFVPGDLPNWPDGFNWDKKLTQLMMYSGLEVPVWPTLNLQLGWRMVHLTLILFISFLFFFILLPGPRT